MSEERHHWVIATKWSYGKLNKNDASWSCNQGRSCHTTTWPHTTILNRLPSLIDNHHNNQSSLETVPHETTARVRAIATWTKLIIYFAQTTFLLLLYCLRLLISCYNVFWNRPFNVVRALWIANYSGLGYCIPCFIS